MEEAIVYKNLFKMIRCRGLHPTSDELSTDLLRRQLIEQEYVVIRAEARAPRPHSVLLVVLVASNSTIGTKTSNFKYMISELKRTYNPPWELLVVTSEILPVRIRGFIASKENTTPCTYYDYEKFIIDVPSHVLVPKHEVMTEEEVRHLCETFHTTPDQYPRILRTDTMSVWIGLRPGQMCRITRASETAGSAIAYRYCVEEE